MMSSLERPGILYIAILSAVFLWTRMVVMSDAMTHSLTYMRIYLATPWGKTAASHAGSSHRSARFSPLRSPSSQSARSVTQSAKMGPMVLLARANETAAYSEPAATRAVSSAR